MRIAGLIPAAGWGTRLGLGPKALVQLAGRSLLERTLEGLRPHVDELLVALPAGLELHDLKPPLPGVRTITGGSTRQDSVRLLLEASDAGLVLIHDAARP
ncbi:MAG: 2-C-methyl-D-erythritol 4-phosphate cytidylyltransferase, partial [Deinococcus sp.]